MHFFRPLFSSLAFGLALLLSAQKQATITPQPNWRLGDKRQVDVQNTMVVKTDGVTMEMKSSSSFVLEVTRAKKEGYELTVKAATAEPPVMKMRDAEGELPMDEANVMIDKFVKAVNAPLGKWQYRYDVDRNGKVIGRVEEKNEKDKLTEAMRQAMEGAITALASETDEPVRIPDAKIWFFVDSVYDAYMQTQLNEMNYLLKVHATEFPLNGSLRVPVSIEDVQAPLYPGMPQAPGMMEVGLDKNDPNELVGRTIITYDPDAVYAYLEKDRPGMVKREGLHMVEESVEHVEKRGGWLTQSTTATRLRSNAITMDATTETRLKVVQ